MTHERLRTLLSDYLEDSLPSAERRELEGHLLSCSECSLLAERFREILRDLHAFPRLEVPAGFTRRVLERTSRRDRAPNPWEVFRSWAGLPRLSPAAAAALLALPLIFLAGTRDGRQISREVSMALHQSYSNAVRLYGRRTDLQESAEAAGRKLPAQIEETVDWLRRRIEGSGAEKAPQPKGGEPDQRSSRLVDRSESA